MSWYALEEIEEAMKETRELVWPPDFWTWTKLALIVFFVGGGFNMGSTFSMHTGSMSGFSVDHSFDSGGTSEEVFRDTAGEFRSVSSGMSMNAFSTLLLAVFAVLVPVVLIMMFIGSVFEFVFYRSLIDKNVNVKKNFRENIWNGARYFGFQLVFLLAVIGLIASVFAAFLVSGVLGLLMMLLLIPVFVVLGVFSGLTRDFVLLRMLEADEKLIEAWVSLWPRLKSEWRQVGVYLVVKLLLGTAVGAAMMFVVGTVTVGLLLPAAVLLLLAGLIAEPLMVLVGVVLLLFWFILLLYLAVPFRTYFYYYIILVYHDLTS